MLCNLVLNGFVDGARDLGWRPGEDYLILSVSFDPKDGPALAKKKQKAYVESLGIEGAGEGWHFLTGEPDQVRMLADSLGFPYRYMEDMKEFAHGAGMFVLAPDGTISRTLYGLSFPERDLRFSFMEASAGRLGTPLDKIVLFCFRYDADRNAYSLVAVNVMKVGGALTALGLAAFLAVMWRRERRRAPHAA
jgi:protein SCO1/2